MIQRKFYYIKKSLFLLLFFGFYSFSQNNKIDSLKGLINNSPKDTNYLKTVTKLCNEFKMIGEFDSAMAYATGQLQIAQKLAYSRGITDAYNMLGILHRTNGDYKKALEYFLKALKIKEV